MVSSACRAVVSCAGTFFAIRVRIKEDVSSRLFNLRHCHAGIRTLELPAGAQSTSLSRVFILDQRTSRRTWTTCSPRPRASCRVTDTLFPDTTKFNGHLNTPLLRTVVLHVKNLRACTRDQRAALQELRDSIEGLPQELRHNYRRGRCSYPMGRHRPLRPGILALHLA